MDFQWDETTPQGIKIPTPDGRALEKDQEDLDFK
jgi:hypothetical protein